MIAITFTAAFVYVVFAMLRPALFAGLFTTDPELIVIVEKVLPVYIAGMAIFGLQSGVQSSFLGLGQAKISPESHSSDPACTHSAAFLRCHGRLLCRTDR